MSVEGDDGYERFRLELGFRHPATPGVTYKNVGRGDSVQAVQWWCLRGRLKTEQLIRSRRLVDDERRAGDWAGRTRGVCRTGTGRARHTVTPTAGQTRAACP